MLNLMFSGLNHKYRDNRLNTFLLCKFANNVDQTVYWTKLNILHPTKQTALAKSCNDRLMFNA